VLHLDAPPSYDTPTLREREHLHDEEPATEGMMAGEPLRGDEELELLWSPVADDIEAALRELSVDARTVVLLDLEGVTQQELTEVLAGARLAAAQPGGAVGPADRATGSAPRP
jgi:DNA-directed RNA polymerase specialized sigma24 family protein